MINHIFLSVPWILLKVFWQIVQEVALICWAKFKFIYYLIFSSWACNILYWSSSNFCFYSRLIALSSSDLAHSSADGLSTIIGSSFNPISLAVKNWVLEFLAFWIFSSINFCLLASALACLNLRFSEIVSIFLIST